MSEVIIVDAENSIAGRLASKVAKLLLEGKKVIVVNIDKAVITGKRRVIVNDFMKRLRIKSNVNPRRHGPFKPRSPDGIFRRMVRGMLPRRKPKGKAAYRRLRVYRNVPEEVLKEGKPIKFEDVIYRENPYGYMTLYEVSKLVGWIPIEERMGVD